MITDFYNSAFVIYRDTEITSSYGAPILTSSVYLTGSCFIEAIDGNEQVVNDKNEVIANYLLITDVDGINEADTLICDNKTYDVKFVDNLHGHHIEILLKKRV
jgi:hypothetical protein